VASGEINYKVTIDFGPMVKALGGVALSMKAMRRRAYLKKHRLSESFAPAPFRNTDIKGT
jgi:hypothetical protein